MDEICSVAFVAYSPGWLPHLIRGDLWSFLDKELFPQKDWMLQVHDGILFPKNTLQLLVLLQYLWSLLSQQHNAFPSRWQASSILISGKLNKWWEKNTGTKGMFCCGGKDHTCVIFLFFSFFSSFKHRNHFPLPNSVGFIAFRNVCHPVSGWAQEESLFWLLYHLKKEDAWCCHLNSPCGRRRKTVLRWSVRFYETLLRRHVNSRS